MTSQELERGSGDKMIELQDLNICSAVTMATTTCRHQFVDVKWSTVYYFSISLIIATISGPTEAHRACDFSFLDRRMRSIQPRNTMSGTF